MTPGSNVEAFAAEPAELCDAILESSSIPPAFPSLPVEVIKHHYIRRDLQLQHGRLYIAKVFDPSVIWMRLNRERVGIAHALFLDKLKFDESLYEIREENATSDRAFRIGLNELGFRL
jgi:hypothetical protein